MLTMYQQITIKTLKNQGKTNKDISIELNCHRNTVANILSRLRPIESQKRDKPSYFDKYFDSIKKYLDQKVSRLRIWEILKAEYTINRTYDALCKYIQTNFPKYREAYVVQETDAGETAEVDFGYLGLFKDIGTGLMKKAYVFIFTLCFSRSSFYCITYDQSVKSFIEAHIKAFSYFGGVTKRVKIDNLKSAVLKNRRYDLEFNKDFLEFSHHYNFVITPCTPYEPQQKGKVESAVGYTKKNFMAGRVFTDSHDLEVELHEWMVGYANRRVHGTTKQIPEEKFVHEEKSLLQPLPNCEFTFYESYTRKVSINCHINLDNNYYSVPYQYIDKTVEARSDKNLIRIYADNEEIAIHPKSTGQGQYVTNPSHFPPDKCYSSTTYQKKYEDKMRSIGTSCLDFFNLVIKKDPSSWGRTIRKTLGLASEVGNQRIEAAVKRAIYFNAIDFNTLKNIIDNNLENLELESKIDGLTSPTTISQEKVQENSFDRSLDYYQLNNNIL